MEPPATHQPEASSLHNLSSQSLGWKHILVEQFYEPPGECNYDGGDEHTINLSLAPRPVRLLQIQGEKTYAGLYRKGDISITPARMPLFARWDSDDRYLQIKIASGFIESVAREAFDMNPDRLELLPEFRMRDRQIESISFMLLSELQQQNLSPNLYIKSV